MPGQRFVPANWQPKDTDLEWAKEKFKIDDGECTRQLEEFRDHEFKRAYTDWNRCFRNWFRTADKHDLLKRPIQRRGLPEELSEEEKRNDQKAFEADMERLGIRVVK